MRTYGITYVDPMSEDTKYRIFMSETDYKGFIIDNLYDGFVSSCIGIEYDEDGSVREMRYFFKSEDYHAVNYCDVHPSFFPNVTTVPKFFGDVTKPRTFIIGAYEV